MINSLTPFIVIVDIQGTELSIPINALEEISRGTADNDTFVLYLDKERVIQGCRTVEPVKVLTERINRLLGVSFIAATYPDQSLMVRV